MYAYIEGFISEIRPNYIVLNNQGVGFLIIVPNPFYYKLGENYKVYTYHYVREDINNLYGFKDYENREFFIKLISVSGIGPKSALSILANDNLNDIIMAIEEGNVKMLTKFPGIGTKSAQQIILDLKGKLVDAEEIDAFSNQSDVELALQALGYNKKEITKILKKLDVTLPIEILIKEALKELSR